MTKRTKRILRIVVSSAFALGFVAALFLFNLSRTHQHCIKNAGLAFRLYATDHDEQYPSHTSGFGDALLQLIKTESATSVRYLTAPGDRGEILENMMRSGGDVPEERCSRIYVQGLSETNNAAIAILFDSYPTRGGDHFRRPWGQLLREVCMLDGSMQTVLEENWGAFATNQIELLVQEGIDRKTAEYYYRLSGLN